jgi:nucleoside triphosphate pyrophosphatase
VLDRITPRGGGAGLSIFHMRLILASTSPRRREILALLGLRFEVIAPAFDEAPSPERSIEDEVQQFALKKAKSVARDQPQSIVIGSDTMIYLSGEKIGKPGGTEDAKRILRFLAGKTHRICTGVALVDGTGGRGLGVVEEVAVKMRDYSEEEIDRYLTRNESLDKAGAYSIQGEGRALIESIQGDYLAAVGLPLRPIAVYLESRGLALPSNVERLYSEKPFLNWQSF